MSGRTPGSSKNIQKPVKAAHPVFASSVAEYGYRSAIGAGEGSRTPVYHTVLTNFYRFSITNKIHTRILICKLFGG